MSHVFCDFVVLISLLWLVKKTRAFSLNQSSVASNPSLLLFFFTSLCDWSIKLAPPFHPIKWKTKINPNMVTCVFPRFKQVACLFWVYHWVIMMLVVVGTILVFIFRHSIKTVLKTIVTWLLTYFCPSDSLLVLSWILAGFCVKFFFTLVFVLRHSVENFF